MEKTLASPQNNLKTMTILKGIKQLKPILRSVLHKPIIPFKALPRLRKKRKGLSFPLTISIVLLFPLLCTAGLDLKKN